MKEIIVLSGKGGTGKTTIMAALTNLTPNAVLADCDVDAPNLHMLIDGEKIEEHEFIASDVAQLDASICTLCGICVEACRFDAISLDDIPTVDDISCEGCGLCSRICPVQAITMAERVSGRWSATMTPTSMMFHARLEPGEGNSGILVTLLKRRAREYASEVDASLILVDGPPGIGCPVIASLSGADIALLVTEPSKSGKSDVERIIKLCRQMNVQPTIVINRWDLHPSMAEDIEDMANEEKIPLLGRIPFDEDVHCNAAKGLTVGTGPAGEAIERIWEAMQKML